MRPSNKSRSRNKNNNRRNNNNAGGNVVNRVFDSAGPDGRVRGTPQQIIEKYSGLARDAQLADDRVAAENFQQHAEHYNRLLQVAQRQIAERQAEHAERQAEQNALRQQQQVEKKKERDEQPDVPGGFEANAGQPAEDTSNLVATPESTQPKPRSRNTRQRKETAPENLDVKVETEASVVETPQETSATDSVNG